MHRTFQVFIVSFFLALGMLSSPAAEAASLPACGNDNSGFENWRDGFKAYAVKKGISDKALAALDGVTYSSQVIKLDRSQKATFATDFESFAAKRVTKSRLSKGKQMLKKHAALLAQLEKKYGVQPEIIVAIWGMETDYGVVSGKLSVIRSLATLAYDCRRSDFFANELLSALEIIDKGYLNPRDLVGAWAGELGQTQFLASNYRTYAVDHDGDGRRDLIRSTADVLASTANLLKSHGWRSGQGYQPGEANFPVLSHWNKSNNYQKAIALFASRLLE